MGKPGPLHRALPSMYGAFYPTLVDVGMRHGYAIALHGSLARDMDVIAVPWTEKAKDDSALVEAIARALGAVAGDDLVVVPPERGGIKPHGRRVWSIVLDGSAFIDLSVLPLRTPTESREEPKALRGLTMETCEDCGSEVSNYRQGCPGCGAPQCCQRCCDEANARESTECQAPHDCDCQVCYPDPDKPHAYKKSRNEGCYWCGYPESREIHARESREGEGR